MSKTRFDGIKRAAEFLGVNPWAGEIDETVKADDLIGVEFLIKDYKPGLSYQVENGCSVNGVGVLIEHEDGREQVLITFSEVVRDQVSRIPIEALPSLATIACVGKGNRKYFTLQ